MEMEFLKSAYEANPLSVKGIVIADNKIVNEFNLALSEIKPLTTLYKVREYLTQKNLVIVGRQNSHFRNKFEYKIPFVNEDDYKLKDILVPTDGTIDSAASFSFFIEKDLTRPGFPEIVRNLNLTKGYKRNERNEVIQANKNAFRIKNMHLMEIITHQTLEEIEDNQGRFLCCVKGTIRLLPGDLEATEEYIEAIEDALNEDINIDIKASLHRVGREYGFFWPKEIILGGKFQLSDEPTDTRELEKLKNFINWRIIDQKDLTSLHTLLPEQLVSRIRRVYGMKLLYHNSLSVHMPKGKRILPQPLPKPQTIPTFKNVKIFTSVIVLNKTKPYRNMFVIRVEYMDDETPYVVIQRIGKPKKAFNLFVPYMIIGYEEGLPTERLPDNSIDHIDTERYQYDSDIHIEHPRLTKDYCIIGTPILKCRDNPGYNFGTSKDVISYHFRQRNNDNGITQLQCYHYDLRSDGVKNSLIFDMNYAIISSQNSDFIVTSAANQNWTYRSYNTLPLSENSRTFTGGRWEVFVHPKPMFASIQYSDPPNHPLFLNIHKKYPIVKSLNVIAEDLRSPLGYVIVRRAVTDY
ncbi:15954_t:CDS:1 [Cetraspora pellucida]|uniref:15954_t:CDS:1 n=1 Tax=Cetraspora pellucida TaxID=1433469 RepID=A0A9N9HSU1_9GLOM|nr:15954_t:CDS:1 [Cetraspora pellucida]